MRAVVHRRYGAPDVLRVEDVERPEPGPSELLVQVHATTVNRTDCGFRQPRPFFVRAYSGWRRPRHPILGTEFSGVVAAVGADVTELRIGDAVFGVNADHFGAHAEYLVIQESGPLATKPAGMTFTEAAAVCDGFVLARTCLTRAGLRAGQRVLIYGASGSIGTAAVQLATALGADVTAVCNTRNVGVVGSLGPRQVIDYTREDFTKSGERYDVVFDAVGKLSLRRCRRSLVPGGVYASTDLGFGWQNPLLHLLTARLPTRKALLPIPRYSKEHVLVLKGLIEAGTYRAVVDRSYLLEQVAEATRYVETGQKTGNVVLTVGDGPSG